MQILILSQEDFKEPEYWIALCDSLGVSDTSESISMLVKMSSITGIEPH